MTDRKTPKVGFVSLGCPKNLVDSEVMLGVLARQGYSITPHKEDADVIVVNTCGFIDSAKKESIDTILEMAALKTEGNCKKLVVAGCLAERYRSGLLRAPGRAPEKLAETAQAFALIYRQAMDRLALEGGAAAAFRLVDATNEFIASREPWAIARDEARAAELDAVLWDATEALV